MANVNAARGLVPYAYKSGQYYNGSVNVYYVPVGNATALYLGDPVTVITNSADANGVPAVGISTAAGGAYVTGVMMGIANNAGQLTIPVLQSSTVYLPASTAAYIYVADDPQLLHYIQEDSVGGALAAGAASRNADLIAGTGSTITGMSGWMLDSSTLATTNTLQLRIQKLLQQADNAIGTYAKWLVNINLSSLNNLTGI